MRLPWPQMPERVRRLPLMSLGLAGLWLVAALIVQGGFAGAQRESEHGLLAAARYALQHPEVAIEPRVLPVAQALMPGFEDNEMFDFLRRKRGEPSESQVHFDGLATEALAALDAHPVRALGVVPAAPRPHAFLTHAMLHAGWLHAAMSVLLLLVSAPLLEKLWGRRILGAAALVWCAASAGVFALVHMGADQALVGGTALVTACVAALVARFRMQEVDLLAWASPFASAELSVPAVLLVPAWLVAEAAVAWSLPGAWTALDNRVGFAAHATAAVLGVATALGVQRLGWEERFGTAAERLVRTSAAPRTDLASLRARRDAGDAAAANEALAAWIARNPGHRDAVLLGFTWAVEDEEPERAAESVVRLIGHELRRGANEIALSHWGELVSHVDAPPVEAQTWLRLATIARQQGEEEMLVALVQAIHADDPAPAVQARAALLIEEPDGALALSMARSALVESSLAEETRTQLEALVARLDPGAEDVGPLDAERKRETPAQPEPKILCDESDRSAFGDVADLSAVDDFPRGVLCEARPAALLPEALHVEAPERGAFEVSVSRVRAVALVGVRGLGPRPVVLLDLFLDGGGMERPLSLLRLRSDGFDPRHLLEEPPAQPLAALFEVVTRLRAASGARLLPDATATSGQPVQIFDDLESYTAQVLRPAAEDLA